MRTLKIKKIISIVLVLSLCCVLCAFLVACDKNIKGDKIASDGGYVNGNVKGLGDGDQQTMTHEFKAPKDGVYYVEITNAKNVYLDESKIGTVAYDGTKSSGNTYYAYVQLDKGSHEFKVRPKTASTVEQKYKLTVKKAQDTVNMSSSGGKYYSYMWTVAPNGLGAGSKVNSIIYLNRTDAGEMAKELYNYYLTASKNAVSYNSAYGLLQDAIKGTNSNNITDYIAELIFGAVSNKLEVKAISAILASMVIYAQDVSGYGSLNSLYTKDTLCQIKDALKQRSNKISWDGTKITKVTYSKGVRIEIKTNGKATVTDWEDSTSKTGSTLSAIEYNKSECGWLRITNSNIAKQIGVL